MTSPRTQIKDFPEATNSLNPEEKFLTPPVLLSGKFGPAALAWRGGRRLSSEQLAMGMDMTRAWAAAPEIKPICHSVFLLGRPFKDESASEGKFLCRMLCGMSTSWRVEPSQSLGQIPQWTALYTGWLRELFPRLVGLYSSCQLYCQQKISMTTRTTP